MTETSDGLCAKASRRSNLKGDGCGQNNINPYIIIKMCIYDNYVYIYIYTISQQNISWIGMATWCNVKLWASDSISTTEYYICFKATGTSTSICSTECQSQAGYKTKFLGDGSSYLVERRQSWILALSQWRAAMHGEGLNMTPSNHDQYWEWLDRNDRKQDIARPSQVTTKWDDPWSK